MDYSLYQQERQIELEYIDDQFVINDQLNSVDEPEPTMTKEQLNQAANFKKRHPELCENRSLSEIFTVYLGEF